MLFRSNNGSLPSDYVLSATSKDVAATITPKTVTLSATKVYDGTTTLTNAQVTIGTGINGESLTTSAATASDAHVVTSSNKSIASIKLDDGTGGLASNYQLPALNSTNAPVTITAATLTPTVSNTGVTKVYDAGTSAPSGFTPTYTYSGLVDGDSSAALSNSGAAYNNANVLQANQVTVSGLSITGVTGNRGSLQIGRAHV